MSAESSPSIKTDSQQEPVSYYKLLIEDLNTCRKCEEDGKSWLLDIGNEKILDLKFVWLQGDILEVNEDSVTLDDSTGRYKIMASNAVQSDNSWLTPGVYCAILGQLQQGGEEPQIVAMKMTDLSRNDVLQNMWKLEVAELKQVLNGLIIPLLDNSNDHQEDIF